MIKTTIYTYPDKKCKKGEENIGKQEKKIGDEKLQPLLSVLSANYELDYQPFNYDGNLQSKPHIYTQIFCYLFINLRVDEGLPYFMW